LGPDFFYHTILNENQPDWRVPTKQTRSFQDDKGESGSRCFVGCSKAVGLQEADKDRHKRTALRANRIQTEPATLRSRLEQPYVDKLEGEITSEIYKETKAKWESRITEIQLQPAALARAEPTSIHDSMRILELTATAHARFKNTNFAQKRELLKHVLSNSVWRDGTLEVELKEIFNLMLKR
jgi:hypothetical protein